MSKYNRVVKGVTVDVYDVLQAWNVTNPAVQHAIKKLFQPGARGNKSVLQDLEEAGQSVARAIEIEKLHAQGLYNHQVAPPVPMYGVQLTPEELANLGAVYDKQFQAPDAPPSPAPAMTQEQFAELVKSRGGMQPPPAMTQPTWLSDPNDKPVGPL